MLTKFWAFATFVTFQSKQPMRWQNCEPLWPGQPLGRLPFGKCLRILSVLSPTERWLIIFLSFLLFFDTNVQLRGKELSFSSFLSFLFILFHLNKKLPRRSVEAGVADRMEEMLPFTKKFCLPFDIMYCDVFSNNFLGCHILDILWLIFQIFFFGNTKIESDS